MTSLVNKITIICLTLVLGEQLEVKQNKLRQICI